MNLKEFSKLLGISQTTVSRALGGYPEVRESTRKMIQEAAIKHNYIPSSRARSLATGRSMMIGHVIPGSAQREMLNPIFADFLAGAGDTYAQHGYNAMLTVANDQNQEALYKQLATNKSVDAVMLQSPTSPDPRVELLTKMGLPFMFHGRADENESQYTWLDINNKRSFERATEFLLDLGHTRIALINGDESLHFAYRRRAGFLAAMAAANIDQDHDIMTSAEMTEDYGYEAAARMLGYKNPPTAFLVSSIISAFGVRRAVMEKGLKIGKDISIITHDDDLSYMKNGGNIPLFTATKSSIYEAGKRCAEILIDRIENPDQPPLQELWETQLIVGESTAAAP